LPALEGPRCARCGDTLDDPSVDLCLRCGTTRGFVDRIVSLGPYDGAWGKLVRVFKFEREIGVGRWLAGRMAERVRSETVASPVEAVTYVPMTRRDRRQRGFNQAEVLARIIARKLHLPLIRPLRKTRQTPPQSLASAADRRTNLRDAFRRLPCTHQHVLLVDDICTTGATVEECARMLKQGGAQSVVSVTVARA
jgi:competence protein ComFC